MGLSFLTEQISTAVGHLNYNFLSELRIRRGQPVIVEYCGEYKYLGAAGIVNTSAAAVIAGDVTEILNRAMSGCVYNYTEQMKYGFITVEHGVRIGIAGEYVTESGGVKTIKSITSLNIRIPHDVKGCAKFLFNSLYRERPYSTLIFSKPGLGKTTMLRDIARTFGAGKSVNVLVFDERGEIAAMDGYGDGFDLGNVDIVRSYNKLSAIGGAIRAMKPQIIITDELYGAEDIKAAEYAADCGICIIASSHITDKQILSKMPFEYFVKLNKIGGKAEIYDKNFSAYCDSSAYNVAGNTIDFG